MADFQVHTADLAEHFFQGKDKYGIGENGVLTVIEEGGSRRLYSPHAWVLVTEGPRPRARVTVR
jgi:hypothetical protein